MDADNLKLTVAQMLIRKPVETVFEAFIDPEITKNFWFTKGSGRLEVDKKIKWDWEMYNMSATIIAKEIIPNRRITIDWTDRRMTVDFEFEALTADSTYVSITQSGFDKTGDELLQAVIDTTGGFTTVVDGLKAYLEHNINLNLIMDKFPPALKNLYQDN